MNRLIWSIFLVLIHAIGLTFSNPASARRIKEIDLVEELLSSAFAEKAQQDQELSGYLEAVLKLLSHQGEDVIEEKIFRIQGLKVIFSLPYSEYAELVRRAVDDLMEIASRGSELAENEQIEIKNAILDALTQAPFIDEEYERKFWEIILSGLRSRDEYSRHQAGFAFRDRALVVKSQGLTQLYEEYRQKLSSLLSDRNSEIKISAIRAVKNLEVQDEKIIKTLKRFSSINFARHIGIFQVKPARVEEARVAISATVTLLKLGLLEESLYERIKQRLLKLGEAVLEELYRSSLLNHVSYRDKLVNLRDTAMIFNELLATIRKFKPEDSTGIRFLSVQLFKIEDELEKIFEGRGGPLYSSDVAGIIAGQGLAETERLLNLDRLLLLTEADSAEVAMSAILILGKFSTYYQQSKELIFGKLSEYLSRDMKNERIASAYALAMMLSKYLPYAISS